MENNKKVINIVKYFCLAACLVFLVKYSEVILSQLRIIGIATVPLILGLIMAYVLNILMKKVEKIYFPNSKNKTIVESRRIVSILLSIFLVIGIIVIVALIVIPEFVRAVSVIIAEIPEVLQNVKAFITANNNNYEVVGRGLKTLQIDIDMIIGNIMTASSGVLKNLLNSILSFMTSFTSGLMNFLIALVFAIYVLVDKEKLSMQVRKIMNSYLTSRTIEKLVYVFDVSNKAFSSFIEGQCVEAVIIGGLCTIGMIIFRFPYAVTVGVFISVTALIPVVGAYLGAALGAIMILTVSPLKALLFLIFITILQQLENNLIYPRVVGSSIGLPGIWVFAAITMGGSLGGIAGMLLSVPVAATMYKLFTDKVNNRLKDPELKV